jgi:aminoglycoside phosphotransferase (APT) family kinase protein
VELLARGRDSDIFDYAPGLVLRRSRHGHSMAREARIMEFVAAQGFPIPTPHELRADDTELVMERVDGPLLLDKALLPWRAPRCMRLLADLHDQLHAITAPEWLDSFGDGGALIHLDFHPANVIMSPKRGPVVIDWPNARRGDAVRDVAVTYALMLCPLIPGPRWLTPALAPIREPLAARPFIRRYENRALWEEVAEMSELKTLDANMHDVEIANLHKLARTARERAAKAPG